MKEILHRRLWPGLGYILDADNILQAHSFVPSTAQQEMVIIRKSKKGQGYSLAIFEFGESTKQGHFIN